MNGASIPADPVLAIDALRCRAGGRTTLAIDRLVVRGGERIGLIGANGAGKSTLLRCLNGFVRPVEGALNVLGQRVDARLPAPGLRELRAGIGHVMQGLHPVQRLSALENVLIGALPRVTGWRGWARVYPSAEIAAAEAALRRVGLQQHAHIRSDRLSGGERQKLAIARMLLQRPRLILADEPTASLDPQAAGEICRLLADAAAGATLITVVHSPALLPLLAERVIGLKQGRIEFDLPLAQLDAVRLAALYAAPAAMPSAPAARRSSNSLLAGRPIA